VRIYDTAKNGAELPLLTTLRVSMSHPSICLSFYLAKPFCWSARVLLLC
jgi:hypothetical protein